MSESTPQSDSVETFEETLSEFLDTALPDTREQEGPDEEVGGAGSDHAHTDTR